MILNNLSIRNRLFFISIPPLIVTAGILLFLVVQQTDRLMKMEVKSARELIIKNKKSELKNIVDIAYRTVKPIYDASGELSEAVSIMQRMEFGEDGYIFGYDGDSVRVFSGPSEAGIGKSYKNFQDSNGVYLINDLVVAGKKNNYGSGDIFVNYHFPRLGEKVPSAKMSYAIYLKDWNLMIGTGIYIDRIDEEVQIFQNQLLETRDSLITSIAITSIIVIVVILFISIMVVNSILTPLSRVSDSITELCEGNGDLTKRVPVDDRFEMGTLSSNLNQLLESLHNTIHRVYIVAKDVKSETNALADRADKIKEVMVKQHSEVDLVASAATQMSASAVEISRNAENAASAAKEVDDNGDRALEKVQRSSQEMAHLVKEITRACDVVSDVGTDVEGIVAILQVIESIAEQTNLLALNAAIEAARAGEQGRGFAVVADEVRNLASKTQGSTDEIQQMITKLQDSSHSAVKVMGQSIELSDSAEGSVNESSSALNEIASSVGVITDMNTQIATAAEEQSAVVKDISQRIVEISDQTSGLNEIAMLNNDAAEMLKHKTKDLEDIVGQFKL